ncbi:Putative ABC transporter substrate-binding protein yesO [Chlamydia abortus]|nr:Putative ABC transporter substrate-binding protein yesO [Chlamydia abortus]
MIRRKQAASWSLVFLLVVSLILSACTKKDAAPGANEDGKPQQVTIKFHAQEVTFTKEMMQPVIEQFEKLNPGIKVDYVPMTEPTNDEIMKKIDLYSASGETLDVFLIADERSYAQRAANGMLEPLNTFIEQEGFNYEEEYKTNTGINGKYYGLPGTFSTWFVMLNEDHLKEANLAVPTIDWTWDDFMDYAKQMTAGEGADKRYGTYHHTWTDYYTLGLWHQPKNNDIILPDLTINLDDPGVRKSIEIRQQTEMVDKSAVPLVDVISQKMSYRPLYFNGKASMIVIGSWMIGEAGGTDQYEANHKTIFAPIPKNNPEDEGGYAVSSSNYLVVSSTSKHKEESYKFARYLSTEGLSSMEKYLTSWKKEDTGKLLEAIINQTKKPEMVDKESLLYVLDHAKMTSLPSAHPFQAEVYKAYQDEVDLVLLGQQDIDQAIANAKDKIQKIINANK